MFVGGRADQALGTQPTEAQEQALIAELEKVKPELTGSRVIVNARAGCRIILHGGPDADQVTEVRARFDKGLRNGRLTLGSTEDHRDHKGQRSLHHGRLTGMGDGIRVGLVCCASQKLQRPAPACELTSPSYSGRPPRTPKQPATGGYVLSAKNGLVHPDTKFVSLATASSD